MGGRVGLKGTDGVVDEALAAGAEPVAGPRARGFAEAFLRAAKDDATISVLWLTCDGTMGRDALRAAGFPEKQIEIVYSPGPQTAAEDTRKAVDAIVDRGAELILFTGGDGTARDVAAAVENRLPILGIPAGVKMHSGVFAVSPSRAANPLVAFVRGAHHTRHGHMLDLRGAQ